MPLSELAVENRVVGAHQVRQRLRDHCLKKLFVAEDADPGLVSWLVEEAQRQGVVVEHVFSMKTLGRACAIDRGAAAAGIGDKDVGMHRRSLKSL